MDVDRVLRLHEECVERWHAGPIDHPYDGFLRAVSDQHERNYRLWHREDEARRRDADDATIAGVKRDIDRLNQERNDRIEALDGLLMRMLEERGVGAPESAPLNTETPGSAIDRLSILALRLYHLRELAEDAGAAADRRQEAERRLAVCRSQRVDLSVALGQLLEDLFTGRKRLKLYRQLKLYNDPRFNPYLSGGAS